MAVRYKRVVMLLHKTARRGVIGVGGNLHCRLRADVFDAQRNPTHHHPGDAE